MQSTGKPSGYAKRTDYTMSAGTSTYGLHRRLIVAAMVHSSLLVYALIAAPGQVSLDAAMVLQRAAAQHARRPAVLHDSETVVTWPCVGSAGIGQLLPSAKQFNRWADLGIMGDTIAFVKFDGFISCR